MQLNTKKNRPSLPAAASLPHYRSVIMNAQVGPIFSSLIHALTMFLSYEACTCSLSLQSTHPWRWWMHGCTWMSCMLVHIILQRPANTPCMIMNC